MNINSIETTLKTLQFTWNTHVRIHVCMQINFSATHLCTGTWTPQNRITQSTSDIKSGGGFRASHVFQHEGDFKDVKRKGSAQFALDGTPIHDKGSGVEHTTTWAVPYPQWHVWSVTHEVPLCNGASGRLGCLLVLHTVRNGPSITSVQCQSNLPLPYPGSQPDISPSILQVNHRYQTPVSYVSWLSRLSRHLVSAQTWTEYSIPFEPLVFMNIDICNHNSYKSSK